MKVVQTVYIRKVGMAGFPLPTIFSVIRFMKVNEQIELKVELPGPSDTYPKWSNSDESVVQVEPDTGGLSAKVTGLKAGKAHVGVVVNCDFGSGVTQHVFPFVVEVDGDEQVAVVLEEPKESVSPYWT